MVEFKIRLEDNVVQTYGHKIIEQRIQDFITQLTLKLAAQDVLKIWKRFHWRTMING